MTGAMVVVVVVRVVAVVVGDMVVGDGSGVCVCGAVACETDERREIPTHHTLHIAHITSRA